MNIAVYGFMGVGKTTVGSLLAEKTGYGFVDMDSVIEERAGMSITEIFMTLGEPWFREIETNLMKELIGFDDKVIACGGGALASTDNAEMMKDRAKLVYLTASLDEILQRTQKQDNRPLLGGDDRRFKAEKLLRHRTPIYRRFAEVIVDTTGKSPELVVEEIRRSLKI